MVQVPAMVKTGVPDPTWTAAEIADYYYRQATEGTRTYEEREEDWLQSVGSSLWDLGIEAGQWLGFRFEQAQDTVDQIATTPSDVVKKIAEGVTDAAEIAVNRTADIVDNAVDKVGETLDDLAEDLGDTAKIMAVGGLVLAAIIIFRSR